MLRRPLPSLLCSRCHPQSKGYIGLVTTLYNYVSVRSTLLSSGIDCFKWKESRFLRFLFSTYARSGSFHHQPLSIVARIPITFVVLFFFFRPKTIGLAFSPLLPVQNMPLSAICTWYKTKYYV